MQVQSWVQELLEEEVTELLGRDKSERRGRVDPASGYRNGYGRQVAGITVPPRVRIWKSALKAGYCRCLPNGRSKSET